MPYANAEQRKALAPIKDAFKLGDTQLSYLECVAYARHTAWVYGTPSQDRRLAESLENKGLIKRGRYDLTLSPLATAMLAGEVPAIDGWNQHLAAVKAAKVAELRAQADRLMDQVIELTNRANALEGK